MHIDSKFWAGTEESLHSYIAAAEAFEPKRIEKMADSMAEGERPPRLFSLVGNIGVISIAGPLVNNNDRWNWYMGVTGYGEIREALIHAAQHPDVGAIVLDVNSGGGSVSGVSDTGDLIARVDAQVVPVHTFSDGAIMSAAYWLGVSARKVHVGKVAEAGSIGTLMVHREVTKAMKDNGVTATVIRSGEFKALGNPYEELSPTAKKVIQGQLDYMSEMFTAHVATRLKSTPDKVDATMGQGRVFTGQQAVDIGLAKSVTTFDALVSKLQGEIDSRKNAPQYGANSLKGTSVKQALTEQQVAALAEGGGAELTAEQKSAAEAEAKVLKEAADKAAAEAAAPKKDEPASGAELTEFLKTSLAAAQAALVQAQIEVRDLKAAADPLQKQCDAMRLLVATSVDRMKIALGGAAGGSDKLDAAALLAEHATYRAQFEAKYKSGGVAAVSSGDEKKDEPVAADPMLAARRAAARIG